MVRLFVIVPHHRDFSVGQAVEVVNKAVYLGFKEVLL